MLNLHNVAEYMTDPEKKILDLSDSSPDLNLI